MNHHTFLAFILPLLIACGGEDLDADLRPRSLDHTPSVDAGIEPDAETLPPHLDAAAYVDVWVSPDSETPAPTRIVVLEADSVRLQIRAQQHLLEVQEHGRSWTVLQTGVPWGTRANIQGAESSTFSLQNASGLTFAPGVTQASRSVTLQFSDYSEDPTYVEVTASGILYEGLDPTAREFHVRFLIRR